MVTPQRRQPRRSLRVLTDIAEDVSAALAAAGRVGKANSSAAVKGLVRAIEREVELVAKKRLKIRRRSRDTSGKFN